MLPADPEILDIVIQNDANKFPEDDNQWLKSIIIKGDSKQGSRRLRIQKVPRIFRESEENQNCFDPLVVSIGPYHRGKPKLQLMEEHKPAMARLYVNNNLEMLAELYKKVLKVAKAARECYTDEDEDSIREFNHKEFARMMFLDGCFVLQFIYCCANNKRKDLQMKNNIAASVQRDLFLLENQLPFLVLKELMSLRFSEEEWKNIFGNFISQIRGPPLKYSRKEKLNNFASGKNAPDDQLVHLEVDVDEPAHLLELFRRQLIDKSAFAVLPRSCGDWSSYRSAKELNAVGIHFRRSKTRQLTDIKFRSMYLTAILNLPPITIDDSTRSMFLNMVAYEACPDSPDDFGVSSYICFMDALIDHAEDVKELRSKGILFNMLGSDQQVANLFNDIADNLVPNPYAFAVVKDRIEKHYKNKINIWLAEWLHAHFTSPWTVLAFLGASLALALSVFQAFPKLLPKSML
ncbi:hypothetical protein OWV82_019937 [Melia azedarach]|uniref:Uncharacterized protein n=1 Tax=Melia azedarach TaxID=155640 RepID=A0ACC1X6D9_MELAZ|nr:hypothetical protein OWV82_019937 [Melia azedarach]